MSPSSHQSLYQQNPSRTSSWHSSEGNQDGAKIHILQYSCVSSMLTMLLDSGSAGNFIHQVTVHHLNILTHPLEQPRKILAIDGGPNGEGLITHCMQPFPLQVRVPHHVHVTLLVTISAKHPMILGLPWLEKQPHNFLVRQTGHWLVSVLSQPMPYIPRVCIGVYICWAQMTTFLSQFPTNTKTWSKYSKPKPAWFQPASWNHAPS